MFLRQIFDPGLAQNAYLIGCQRTGEAIVVDPLRDVDQYLQLARENGLRLEKVAETHIHADFLSGARELVETHGATGYLSGLGGEDWQSEWARSAPRVQILGDGDRITVGKIEIEAVHTPGHTPEHLSYLVTDYGGGADQPALFITGDFIFVGDVGRPDLLESAAGVVGMQEPGARALRESLRATARIPGHVQVLPAHGAGSACGKALGSVPTSVLDYERLFNAPLKSALSENEESFVVEILRGQPEPPLYFARMKRDNKLGPGLLESVPQPPRVRPAEMDGLANDGSSPWFLDLRSEAADYMERHLAGSLHCPPAGVNVSMVAGSYLAAEEEIILLVENEQQVEEVVRQLIRIGLDRILGWMPVAEALAWADQNRSLRKTSAIEGSEMPGKEVSVLDVRSAQEFAEDGLPGAVNIPHTRLRARKSDLPASAPLYVHCATGKRAAAAVSYLESLGREVVWVNGPCAGAACALA